MTKEEKENLSPDELQAEKIISKACKKVGYDRKPLNKKVKGFFVCLLSTIVITLTIILLGLYSLIWICVNGPSERARFLFVSTVKETSAVGFLADWFVPAVEVKYILTYGETKEVIEDTDIELIQIPSEEGKGDDDGEGDKPITEITQKDIEIIDIVGSTYRGKLTIIKDPSRVLVGTCGGFGDGYSGKTLDKIVSSYGAVLGVNASGFEDEGGSGSGAVPIGIVISEGQLLWGDPNAKYDIIGFDANHILILDTMTANEAIERGIRDAVSFGPILVKNGTPIFKNGGMNPRTAIGQRQDGSVLLLVIEGRQVSSIGATMRDLTNIMVEYGAVNAANLDGGSSSSLYYNDKFVIQGSYIFGVRKIPNAFIVK